jgi:hypothetical protein
LQNLPQWTPQLNRILSLAPAEPAPQIDWDALGKLPKDAPDPFLNTKWREAAASQVRQAFGPDASIFLVKGHDVQFVSGLHGADLFPNQFNNPYRVYNGKQVVPNFLADVCGLQPSGVFTLVSQIAPGGGRNFDDLTLLDSSDPQQWMLVVAVQRGDDLLIYRKVYRGAN